MYKGGFCVLYRPLMLDPQGFGKPWGSIVFFTIFGNMNNIIY